MPASKERILFITGKLAEKRLHKVLQSMQPSEFNYEIRNIGVSVASLMTAEMLVRRLKEFDPINKIIVPGLCQGDLEHASKVLGVEIVRGPIDMRDLPIFFGQAAKKIDLSRHRVSIFAEIVDAPMLEIDEIMRRAKHYRTEGADVIDLGCLPDTPFPHLEESIQALKTAGFKTSVDSLETKYLLTGGKAGADYLFSLSEDTLWIADEVESIPIIIPTKPDNMMSLYRAVEKHASSGRDFFADPILGPIHFGFTDSILRYHELRNWDKHIPIIMGIGNLTELTEADTNGINTVLFGIISELQIDAVLATQVSPHCRTAIKEAEVARRMMYAAHSDYALPKGYTAALTGLHSRRPNFYSREEVDDYHSVVRDPSYRVQITEEGIAVYNRDGLHIHSDPFTLFPKLADLQEDASHAFYMGVELARAQVAWQLGKVYHQDAPLDWGVGVSPQRQSVDRHIRKEPATRMRKR